jgi:hypothetical protein
VLERSGRDEVSAATPAQETRGSARDWWLRALLVLQHPRAVFVALRDDAPQSLSDRTEPVMAIVLVAGIALALASRTAGHLLDSSDYDGLLVAVWAFIGGSITGVFSYFIVGGLLHTGVRILGSQGTYRRNRQIVAFAAVPIALSLVLVPLRLALYGGDIFRAGGRDAGAPAHVFAALELAFVAWSGVLLVVGVKAVHGWTWARALGACVLAAAIALALGAAVYALRFVPAR